ncbi:MAG: integrase arm-type DNA-binding domain-containing protein [Desulfosalsimonas sp.]|uniref:integrase arm-type DNA-binding domain-containing protein n=1 Tax=Desulfosalsimonas sp. TaxID=3073848 RepID=UPI0039707BA0
MPEKKSKKVNRQKLTKPVIENLKLPESGQRLIWDAETRGFGIRLTPKGKVFICQGKVNAKDRRVKIGEFGIFTVDQARKQAKKYLQDMANGIDPNGAKRRKIAESITLEQVAEDYKRDRDLKETSIKDIDKRLNGPLSVWKDKPVVDITRDDVMRLFRELSERGKASANLSFRIARALFNYAMEAYRPGGTPIITANPVNVLSGAKLWHRIEPKNRRIPLDRIGEVWNFLESLRADPATTMAAGSIVDAVSFAILTGARWGEVSGLTWDRVNLEAGTWHIPDPKNKQPVTLPLSTQAQALLQERPRYNDHVFCSNKSKTGHIGPSRFITDQITEIIGTEISAHDLRRTFRSIAAEIGVELWRTKLLLNHRLNNDVTIASYTEKFDLEYLRPDIEKIGAWIERQAAHEASGNVIDISVGRAANE